MEVRDLLRFEHCSRTVYKLEDPAGLRCPVCGVVVRSGLMEAPVRIQIPVGNGHRAACCFLIACRDGVGGFSEDNESELHVGISNSQGVVFSYTESGVQCQQQGWEQSIIVPLIDPNNDSPRFRLQWDKQLETVGHLNIWTPERFHEQREFGSCCYGFALTFINNVMTSEGKQPISRECFTSKYVLPRMEMTSRYLSVYRHVCQHGHYTTAEQDSP